MTKAACKGKHLMWRLAYSLRGLVYGYHGRDCGVRDDAKDIAGSSPLIHKFQVERIV